MRSLSLLSLLVIFCFSAGGQNILDKLTVEKIMRNPKWIGTPPTSPYWSPDSKTIYFNWNPENATADSLYKASFQNNVPQKVTKAERKTIPSRTLRFNKAMTLAVYEKNGDVFIYDLRLKKTQQITDTPGNEVDPNFSADDKKITFTSGINLFSWEISNGKVSQLTDFRQGKKQVPSQSAQERWLKKDQLQYFKVLNERNSRQEQRKKIIESEQPRRPKEIYTDDRNVELTQLSPGGKFITYRLSKKGTGKTTVVPNYVTLSGFTEDIPSRTKVGATVAASDFYLYDIIRDTTYLIGTDGIPGIFDTLSYVKRDKSREGMKPQKRDVEISSVVWSEDGKQCIVTISSHDFKDRWIMLLDPLSQKLSLLYREHNDAWIGGPIGDFFGNETTGWLSDGKRIWFTSEETGYCHLYTIDIESKTKQPLTSGSFEVQRVIPSRNKQWFYLITNKTNPGEKQIYRLPASGGDLEQLTAMAGAHEVILSPDEKFIAYRYSYSNKPWELFLMENKVAANSKKITSSLTSEFKSYPWRDPEIITFKARDEANLFARIYKPDKPNGAAVIFVHGAGYLQNAHKWWSSYFREYMFHNLLADLGYTVLDIDYRASAGYGRDWRTGIYRFMGGKDLTDNLDGAKLLVDRYKIDPKRIGIYGGSYGGFITLMAMFTSPDTFAAGAALRPVTDWAHYNHPYTGSILNIPYSDSLSYAKSSPLYYAEGLKGALLICHGMVDTNVHFQDAVLLAQRLIELGKENWELAAYPMEDHAFTEPSSWTDEYKRILKLFEVNLNPE